MTEDANRRWVDAMPEAYEHHLVPAVFEPFARDLAQRAAAHNPGHMLELAAGTGVLTRQLVKEVAAAELVATDLNDAMVEYGRRHVPQATWQQADATNLPFKSGAFDVVTCQFGVMFFPDKPAAFAEARRVLAPEGTFLFNTWDEVGTHDFAAALVAALAAVFGEQAPSFVTDIPHGYHDLDAVLADLRAGGFTNATHQTVRLAAPATAESIAVGFCTGTPLRAEIEARADLATATAAIAGELRDVMGAGTVSGGMTAHVIEAAISPVPE